MKKIFILFPVLFLIITAQAQIGIGTNPLDPSAILHVQDTAKGMLISRMTEAQRIAIVNPAQGLLVYQQNNAEGFWYFTSGQWKNLSAMNSPGKVILCLQGDITNAQATTKVFADYGPNTEQLRIMNCTNLTSLNLSTITTLAEIKIINNKSLQSVSFDNLQYVEPSRDNILDFSGNHFSSAQVNYFLHKLVTLTNPIKNRQIILTQSQLPYSWTPAPPTGQGITDRATLISLGNTVTTD